MNKEKAHLSCEIELKPGEKLSLPSPLGEIRGPGRWLLTLQPLNASSLSVRDHGGFLKSFAPEDEGLYDDYPPR